MAALYRADSLSCQSLGFLVEARYSTEPTVEKKLSYKLIRVYYTSTYFEMFLFVILPFDSAQGERAVLPYMGYRGMSSLKGCAEFLKTFWSEIEYRFWSFWSQTGYGFCTPVSNCLACSVFFRRSYVVFHHYRYDQIKNSFIRLYSPSAIHSNHLQYNQRQ